MCGACVYVSVSPHSLQSVLYAWTCRHTNGSSEPLVQPLSEGSLYFSTGMSEDYTVPLLFHWPPHTPLQYTHTDTDTHIHTYIKAAQRSAQHWAWGTLVYSLSRPLAHTPHLPAGIANGNHGLCVCACVCVCVFLSEKNYICSLLGVCMSEKVFTNSYVIHFVVALAIKKSCSFCFFISSKLLQYNLKYLRSPLHFSQRKVSH